MSGNIGNVYKFEGQKNKSNTLVILVGKETKPKSSSGTVKFKSDSGSEAYATVLKPPSQPIHCDFSGIDGGELKIFVVTDEADAEFEPQSSTVGGVLSNVVGVMPSICSNKVLLSKLNNEITITVPEHMNYCLNDLSACHMCLNLNGSSIEINAMDQKALQTKKTKQEIIQALEKAGRSASVLSMRDRLAKIKKNIDSNNAGTAIECVKSYSILADKSSTAKVQGNLPVMMTHNQNVDVTDLTPSSLRVRMHDKQYSFVLKGMEDSGLTAKEINEKLNSFKRQKAESKYRATLDFISKAAVMLQARNEKNLGISHDKSNSYVQFYNSNINNPSHTGTMSLQQPDTSSDKRAMTRMERSIKPVGEQTVEIQTRSKFMMSAAQVSAMQDRLKKIWS